MFRLDACVWPSYFYLPPIEVGVRQKRVSEIQGEAGKGLVLTRGGFAKSVAGRFGLDSLEAQRYYAGNLYLVAVMAIRPHILGR